MNENITKKRYYDREYSTQYIGEVAYLSSRGFQPCYIKPPNKYGVITYKYKKTPELLRAAADFTEEHPAQTEYVEVASDADS